MKTNVDIYDSEVKDIFVDESGNNTAEITGSDSDRSIYIGVLNLKLVCYQNYAQWCVSENFRSTTQHRTSK
jgi:hypothetical protein